MTTKLLRLATVAGLFIASVLQAAIPPAENLLPTDTLAFLTIPDYEAARVSSQTSPFWMFWNDASMRPFREHFMAKWNEQFVAPVEHDLGVKISDYTSLPQGQFTLAVTINGSNGHDDIPPGFLCLLDAKGKTEFLKTNLAALTKRWTEAGRAVRTETIHGLAFTVVPLTTNDFAGVLPKKQQTLELGKEPPKPEKPGEIYIGRYDSLLILGNSPKAVEPVVAHLTGGSTPAIADSAVFAADKLAQFRDNPKYYGWFNAKGLVDLLAQAPAKDDSDDLSSSPIPGLSPAKILSILGINAVKSVAVAFYEKHEGATLTVHVNAPESERAGLIKMLALPPRDASVPPFVPADAVKFTRFRLDGRQAWAEIQKMVVNLSPSGQNSLDAIIKMANYMGQQKNPGFDIRNDLLGNLGDDIITYQKPPAGASLEELAAAPSIYLVAVSNPDAAINAIKTVGAISAPQSGDLPPREFLGRKIYSIPLKSLPAGPGVAAKPRALHISSSGGYIAISTDSAIVEEFLRNADGKNKPLRDNASLNSAMQSLHVSATGLFGYENQRETMRTSFMVFKNTTAGEAVQKSLPPMFRSWMDFSLLPDYDLVSKYFYLSVCASSANAEGVSFKYFSPRPPQLN